MAYGDSASPIDAQAQLLEPPESPGREGRQAPPCAGTFGVGFWEERVHADRDHARATPFLETQGLLSGYPTLWVLGLPPLSRPA